MKAYFDKIILILLLICSGLVFHRKNINEFPSGNHAWAQSDRYALAIGFTKNKLDFFHPQTFIYNPAFPWFHTKPCKSSITAVDFPIHDYIPAVFMYFAKSTAPIFFRLYILLYSFTGLFFLYLLGIVLTTNKLISFFVVIFAMTSPLFIHYQSGFLPTIPSLANLIIGLYFYFIHIDSGKLKNFIYGIIFLTLSALARTPFTFFLITVFGIETLQIFTSRSFNFRKIITILFSILVIIGYYFYNLFLRNKFGSAFLFYPLPAENFSEFVRLLQETYDGYKFDYFTKWHYLILGFFIIVSIINIFFQKKGKSILKNILRQYLIISSIGSGIYFVLMIKQFPVHDYYFIDTFYMVVILILLYILRSLNFLFVKFRIFGLLFVCCVSLLFFNNDIHAMQKKIDESLDFFKITKNDFDHSDKFLDKLQISHSAKILTICVFAPNLPFILMNRNGYVIHMAHTDRTYVSSAISWDYDYVVIPDRYLFSKVMYVYPEIINKIELLASNGRISIFKKRKSEKENSILSFLKINESDFILKKEINFDLLPDPCWANTYSIKRDDKSNSSCGFVNKDMEYGVTLSLPKYDTLTLKKHVLGINLSVYAFDSLQHNDIVVSIQSNKNVCYYQSIRMEFNKYNINHWVQQQYFFTALPVLRSQAELRLYVLNDGRFKLDYDDLNIRIY